MNNEDTEESTNNNTKTIIHRMKDPLTIFSVLSMINYIVLLILFFVQPFWREVHAVDLTDTYYYWNGNFTVYNSTTAEFVKTESAENFPIGASIVYLIAIISMLICTVIQIISLLFSKNMTKRRFLEVYTWPNFIFNGLMIAGVFTFVNWMFILKSRFLPENVQFQLLTSIQYGAVLSILLTVVSISFAIILSIKRTKD